MPENACPACRGRAGKEVERHRDPVSATDYALRRCAACGLVFAQPRVSVGAAWYAAAVPDETPLPPERDWRFRAFLADAPAGTRVLDVGCGEGQFLRLARERGCPGVGFDWDERRTARARAAGLDACTRDWEAFLASRRDGEFGAACLFDVLEHAPEPAALIGGLRRLLEPGGLLAITVPNESRPLPLGREAYDYPPHHFTRWTRSAMKSFLEREGFRVLRQDAAMRESFYLRDVLAAKLAFEPAARLARRLRGDSRPRAASEPAQAPPPLSRDAARARSGARAALFAVYSAAAKTALWPVAAGLGAWYRAARLDPGHCLYTLAQKNG
ncbi:MAG: class I SAM-dependent methyltransferase [Elusimicrobia bacterium]|nr:class I SAM-dependent methyltransferase [Elusimicrobiota bacterium]